ncbi:zinc metalloprotease HtpX [Candidatus Falkowbacteria bacterium RBG_13_39_14]|uniref:Protease HtpX homolog n=1 Tax=Candidatus Falkowbacteria bacterium RBG_13_39_14 TaxID=1797985 RepID=A0A1F5S5E4_9BACT|nr:MAG: zinc metalloprotease HtpX [Candidatus Falkowbacteria bacterium RBG_13_39_14]
MYSQIDSNKRKSFFLIAIFIIVVVALGWFFGELIGGYGYKGLIIALLISWLMVLFSYYRGDKVALWSAGAKEIQKNDNPFVWRLIENLCITAGLPMPRVYIIPDAALNAFATGRDPKHASIALTAGIIDALEKPELEGVIAHELSHVKNYDIRIMTIVIVLAGTLALLADFFLRSRFWGFGRRRDRDDGGLGVILLIAGIILAILAPIAANLIQLAISRKREFLADASGALLTRYPQGLANALAKISTHSNIRRASGATAHLYIANPFAGSGKFLGKLFSTHPPIEERIAALQGMEKNI